MNYNIVATVHDIAIALLLFTLAVASHLIVDHVVISKKSVLYFTRWRGLTHLLIDVVILFLVGFYALQDHRHNSQDWFWFSFSSLAGLYALINAGRVIAWISSKALD